MQYYSTHPVGFSKICKEILLKEDSKVQISEIGSNYIAYNSELPIEKIKSFVFFEQTFLLVKYFQEKDKAFSNQADWFYRNASSVNYKLSNLGENRSYRIVGSSNSLDNSRIQTEINQLDNVVNIDRGGADYDIRIVEKENHGFIGVRITQPAEFAGYLQKGSLRKEIAYYMLYLSEMNREDIFLDPFCGGGIIPILRSQTAQYKQIICSDKSVDAVTQKVQESFNPVKSFKVIKSDINSINKRLQNKVTKIVTDPPWGLIEEFKDIDGFYKNILERFYNLLEPNGIVQLK